MRPLWHAFAACLNQYMFISTTQCSCAASTARLCRMFNLINLFQPLLMCGLCGMPLQSVRSDLHYSNPCLCAASAARLCSMFNPIRVYSNRCSCAASVARLCSMFEPIRVYSNHSVLVCGLCGMPVQNTGSNTRYMLHHHVIYSCDFSGLFLLVLFIVILTIHNVQQCC